MFLTSPGPVAVPAVAVVAHLVRIDPAPLAEVFNIFNFLSKNAKNDTFYFKIPICLHQSGDFLSV